MTTYYRIILTTYVKYISITGNCSMVITDYENNRYGHDTFITAHATAAIKSMCNDVNKCSKETFDTAKEKAKKMLINNR